MWPFSKSLTHFQRGNRLLVRKDYGRAIREFEAHAIAAPAESAAAFSQIAECYLRCNFLKKPQSVAPGIALVSAGDPERAKEYFEKALAVDPKCLRALSGLADLLPEESEDRKKLLERAAALKPNSLRRA